MKKYSWLLALVAIFALAFAGFVSCGGSSDDGPKVAVTGITLDKATLGLDVGETGQLTATIAPADATNKKITWESSNPAVATVSAAGLVTAVAVGDAIVVATTEDGGFEGECTVTVYPAGSIRVESVALNKTALPMVQYYTDDTLEPIFTPTDAYDKSGSWSSNNIAVATVVSGTGVVTALTPGTATITFTSTDGGKTATCEVTVTAFPAFKTSSTELDLENTPYGSNSTVFESKEMTAYILSVPDNYFMRVILTNDSGSATIARVPAPIEGTSSAGGVDIITRIGSSSTSAFVTYNPANRNDVGVVTVTGTMSGQGHFDIPMSKVKTEILKGDNQLFSYQLVQNTTAASIDEIHILAPCDGTVNDGTEVPCMCAGCFKDAGTVPHTFCLCCIPAPFISITTQPAGANVLLDYTGQSLTVVADINHPDGSNGPLAYQWYSNATQTNSGGTLIDSATNATYNIPDGLGVGDYFYYVVISATGTSNTPIASSAVRFRVEAAFVAKGFNLASYIAANADNFIDYGPGSTQYTVADGTGIAKAVRDLYIGTKNRIRNDVAPPILSGSGTDTTQLLIVQDGALIQVNGNNIRISIGSGGLELDLVNRRYNVRIVGETLTLVTTGTEHFFDFRYFSEGNAWTANTSIGTSGELANNTPFEFERELPFATVNMPSTNPILFTDVVRLQVRTGSHFKITEFTITDIGPRNP